MRKADSFEKTLMLGGIGGRRRRGRQRMRWLDGITDFHFIMSLFKKTELTKIFTIFNKHKKFITLKIWFLHKQFCKAIILQVRINTVFKKISFSRYFEINSKVG